MSLVKDTLRDLIGQGYIEISPQSMIHWEFSKVKDTLGDLIGQGYSEISPWSTIQSSHCSERKSKGFLIKKTSDEFLANINPFYLFVYCIQESSNRLIDNQAARQS